MQDYPAMQSLMKDYCTQAASNFYYQAVRKLNFIALSQEDQEIMRENKFVNVALRELNRAFALESASECIERYLDSWPEPDAVLVQYEDSDDREYSAAAYTILKFLWEQLKGLSDFQPGLSDLVDFTLVAADTQPDKDAMQRYGDALLLRYSGIRAGNKLYEQLRMKMLSRLSLPKESPKARKHPDITSRSYLVADNLSEAVMAEFLQGLLILVCVAIYAVLIQSIATDGDPIGAIWGCVGYTVLLCFTLFKTGSLAKSIFGCH